jgi:fucose permease
MVPVKNPKILTTGAYYAAFAAMGISMAALGPTLPGLAAQTRSSLSEISILFTARSLGSLLGSFGGGQVYDRLRGHLVMATTIVSIAALTGLTPFLPILWILTAVMFITGAIQGILNIGGNTLLIWLHGREVGPFMNGLHFFFGLGTFITPVIVAQFVARQDGLIWTYLLLAVIILPTAVLAFLPSPPSPQTAAQRKEGKIDPLLIVLIALVFACYNGASATYGGWIYTYALKSNLADAKNAAYLSSIFWAALSAGRLAAIPLAIRFKPQIILRADFFGALVSLLAMLLWPRSMVAVIITSIGFGFSLASIYPTTMSYSGQLMTLTGRVTGLFSIGGSVGGMLLPWLIGQFFDSIGPQAMTPVLFVDMVIALGVLVALARYTAPQPVAGEVP